LLQVAPGRGPVPAIMVSGPAEEQRIAITDFGLSQALGGGDQVVRAGHERVGSISYMAPEQVLGHELSPATDIFAFGVVLFEMLCAQLPFAGHGATRQTALRRLAQKAVPPSQLRPEIGPAFDRLVASCLMERPQDRCASAEQALAMLDDAVAVYRPSTIYPDAALLRPERRSAPRKRRAAHRRPEPGQALRHEARAARAAIRQRAGVLRRPTACWWAVTSACPAGDDADTATLPNALMYALPERARTFRAGASVVYAPVKSRARAPARREHCCCSSRGCNLLRPFWRRRLRGTGPLPAQWRLLHRHRWECPRRRVLPIRWDRRPSRLRPALSRTTRISTSSRSPSSI
jgi:hypothetical protein